MSSQSPVSAFQPGTNHTYSREPSLIAFTSQPLLSLPLFSFIRVTGTWVCFPTQTGGSLRAVEGSVYIESLSKHLLGPPLYPLLPYYPGLAWRESWQIQVELSFLTLSTFKARQRKPIL